MRSIARKACLRLGCSACRRRIAFNWVDSTAGLSPKRQNQTHPGLCDTAQTPFHYLSCLSSILFVPLPSVPMNCGNIIMPIGHPWSLPRCPTRPPATEASLDTSVCARANLPYTCTPPKRPRYTPSAYWRCRPAPVESQSKASGHKTQIRKNAHVAASKSDLALLDRA